MNISTTDYWAEVKETAQSIVDYAMAQCETKEEAEELVNDTLLHETIDSHQWVIYTAYNLDVIQHSDNADHYNDNYCHIAFLALYADVQEELQDAFDRYEDEHAQI